jgi:nitroimidazol reductase NimA-like FMN-containing flavoprotein (pyridoxamine 5'-phosphate oxidase superfamily)
VPPIPSTGGARLDENHQQTQTGVEMRRKDREIQSRDVIDEIIAQAEVCRLGLSRDNRPYIVPVSFGYDGRCLYFFIPPKRA